MAISTAKFSIGDVVKHKHFQAFTLIETITTLIVSGVVFVGVFSIFAIFHCDSRGKISSIL